MRSVLFLIFSVVCLSGFTQPLATTFKKAIDQGISIERLDSLYKPALSSDSSTSVFVGKEKTFYEGYVSLLKELSIYLKKNNYTWGKTTRCFNRIYFNKEGHIEYFLFNFKAGDLAPAKEQQFEKLLAAFIQMYRFPLQANSKFAQCSPVTYSD